MKNTKITTTARTMTAAEILDAYRADESAWLKIRETDTQHYGLYQHLHKAQAIDFLFAVVPDGVKFHGLTGRVCKESGVWLPNVGDVCECLVEWADTNCPDEVTRSNAGQSDYDGWEIKTSLVNGSKNTPLKEATDTILVNKCGFFKISARDVHKYLNRHGQFPADKPCGTPWEKLNGFFSIDEMKLTVKQ